MTWIASQLHAPPKHVHERSKHVSKASPRIWIAKIQRWTVCQRVIKKNSSFIIIIDILCGDIYKIFEILGGGFVIWILASSKHECAWQLTQNKWHLTEINSQWQRFSSVLVKRGEKNSTIFMICNTHLQPAQTGQNCSEFPTNHSQQCKFNAN